MIRKNPALAAVAVLGAGLLALTACAPTQPGPETDPNDLPAVGWTPVDPADLADGGTLNLAVSSIPTDAGNWNPNTSEGAEVDPIAVEAPSTGQMIRLTADGAWEPDPSYAESVELISEDPQVVEVKLNKDAVWEDGSPLTATDYQATFAALSGKDTAYNIASSAGFEQITSFEIVDDYDFKVTFDPIYADWAAVFQISAVPAAIANDAEAWSLGYVDKPLPSNGPFLFTKVDNDAKTVTAERNPKWWGPAPKLDKITFTVIDQEAQAQSFANDEIDAIEVLTPDAYISAQEKSGAQVLRSGGVTYAQVTFNGTAKPLDDVKVRQAIAHGIDRDIIGEAANKPLGAPAAPNGNYIFMPGQDGYEDTAGEALAFDQEKAKSLLTEAGWTNADGTWTKDGEELDISVIVPQGTASNELRAQQIQASLAEIDVKVTIDAVPGDDYFNDIIDGKYELATFGWQGTAFNISSSESLFTPAQEPGDQGGQNYAFVTDDRLEDLWAKANAELDPAKRLEVASEINDVIASYVPMLPLYAYPEIEVVDGDLANYGPATFLAIDWTEVGFTE
ncbi:MAG TPA: ABC transporter family substrate-binding protein [Pseudolysinimonas sp.]|nr:ABC transporter family substrate-binding protein [Pseudolysinimonas sp.]